ncbi:MAG: hypothetical protein JWR12_2429 [Mucilaginibacter sp.]|nr:hypothetical protein [Mucilaginibacter sp.]
MNRFSKRNGHLSVEKEIVIREGAPRGLRQFIPQVLYDLKLDPSEVRKVVCRVLRVAPDTDSNWGEPNISNEVNQLLEDCDWYYVYDVIERFYEIVRQKTEFTEEINDYFKANGIGWQLVNGQIEFRGDESFEMDLKKAEIALASSNFNTARSEIREAIGDLSRRPKPDITGSIQHAGACLECVAREVTGNTSSTLGEIIKKNRGIVPPPIDIIIEKIWGFTSEQGRHLRENGEPGFDEAELMVGLCASISTYLARKKVGLKSSATPSTTLDF